MLRPTFTLIFVAAVSCASSANAQSGATTPTSKPVRGAHARTLGHATATRNRSLIGSSSAACNRHPGISAQTPGALGPNGPSQSQTLVAVPIGGGSVTSATRQQQIAEACSHIRR